MAFVQYQAKVGFDASLIDVGFLDTENSVAPGLAISASKTTTGAPSGSNVAYFAPGATITNIVDGTIYRLFGGAWVRSVASVVFAGTATGQTGATRAYTITGLLATDIVSAVIRASTNAVTIQKATASADTLTVLFSADPGASTSVDYIAVRAS